MKRIITLIALFSLCISLAACKNQGSVLESDDGNYIENPTENTTDNNVNDDSSKPTKKTDPNGYDSVEALMDFYMRAHTGQTVSKDEVYRMYPAVVWEEGYRETSLDETYQNYVDTAESVKSKYTQKYGADYQVSYEVESVDSKEEDYTFSQEEIDLYYELLGVHPKEVGLYEVAVKVTVRGSIREETNTTYVRVRVLGDKWYGY